MRDFKILETEKLPSEDRLRMMAKDPDLSDVALQLIAKHKMPYIIEAGELRSAYSQGELYIQKFLTVDKDMVLMKDDALKAAKSPNEVLVQGPTGTGKDIISMGMIGDRKGEIMTINCAGLPSELVESELFGHTRGSFTGANENKDGLITKANQGLMFMDEIGDLPIDQQAKLLRVLQNKTIRKVGSKTEEKITCKFVFATNKNLEAMVKEGTFREDLYARIHPLILTITPLNERLCDAIPIATSLAGGPKFLERYGEDLSSGLLDLRYNVRSIQGHVIRYNVFGRLTLERVKQ